MPSPEGSLDKESNTSPHLDEYQLKYHPKDWLIADTGLTRKNRNEGIAPRRTVCWTDIGLTKKIEMRALPPEELFIFNKN